MTDEYTKHHAARLAAAEDLMFEIAREAVSSATKEKKDSDELTLMSIALYSGIGGFCGYTIAALIIDGVVRLIGGVG